MVSATTFDIIDSDQENVNEVNTNSVANVDSLSSEDELLSENDEVTFENRLEGTYQNV